MRIFTPLIRRRLASRRFFAPFFHISRFRFQTLFIYFILSLTTLIFVRYVYALSESIKQMPTDVPFNRGVSGALAGYDNGGGLVSALAGEVRIATSSAWMDGAYLYKRSITLKNLSGQVLTASASAQVTVNTKALFDSNKLQNDCDDLRVAFVATQSANLRMQLGRSYTIASGATNCADSTATIVTFPRMEPLGIGVSDSNYELYYGNTNATAPSGTGYDIRRADGSVASATLVCPFNGSTTCMGQSGPVTPTTATGAIRYSGGKGAMSFDGVNDVVTVTHLSDLNTYPLTIETWLNYNNQTGNNAGILNKYAASSLNGYNLYITGGHLKAWYFKDSNNYIYDGNLGIDGGTLTTGWHHIAFTVDENGGKIYVDGHQTGSLVWTGIAGNCTASTNVSVGQYAGGYVGGLFDEVRISNIARYTSNFTPQTTPFEPDANTKLLLHFDENGDDPRYAGKTIDSSGNGNHGTISGAKYVSGLIGVDASSSDTGALPVQSYAGHQGVFIEEGTTNLITNPSFEHTTYNTNWGTNYFNYVGASATFTPNMAKRNSAGPFAAGPMVQGKMDGSGTPDSLTFSRGSLINGNFYQNIDANQGSITFWITPEWNSTDGVNHALLNLGNDIQELRVSKSQYNTLTFSIDQNIQCSDYLTYIGGSWSAGETKLVTIRWDLDNNFSEGNNCSISVNDTHVYKSFSGANPSPASTAEIGSDGGSSPANAIIEGLTIYRRPLFDGQYGIDVGNGDEINKIWNNGAGQDPTLITGSWDVVFALPTNASTGTLTSGTGNAWSHPHASNLLYTNTTNTGGFMMNGTYTADGFGTVGSPSGVGALATAEKIFSGGYKYTSTGANQGIYRSFTATNGGDYVLRALGHSDGTCNPQVKITRADGTTEISHLNGKTTSTRTAPDVYIFTWESPAAESEQVQLVNTASSGTCYWHQVEVLGNKIDNSGFERGFIGTPSLPSGYCNGTDCSGDNNFGALEEGDVSLETTLFHSGQSSLKYNSGFTPSEFLMSTNSSTYVGRFFSAGGYSYGNGSFGGKIGSNYGNRGVLQHTVSTGLTLMGSPNSGWSLFGGVERLASNWDAIGLNGAGSPGIYVDDLFYFALSDVSLTVTPASQANSTETSGLRVDGADTLTQPITGLSATSGVIKFKFTPRHSISTQSNFGNPSYSTIVNLYNTGNDQIYFRQKNSQSELELGGIFNGNNIVAYTSGISFNAGTTYDIEISYVSGGSLILKINGAQVASVSGVVSFGSIPNTVSWGNLSVPGYTYDGAISNFTALTPTENTTAPYYKFGSKSAKLVNAGTMPDEYTISINPASTATHTLTAYVYDGTTGNVGGIVSATIAKLVFNGSAVTPASYTDMGGGWWRLAYSAATVNQAGLYGVQALAGKTIYVDGVQLEAKTYATTYADGSLDTTGKYDWTGTANASSSTRTISNLQFPNSNTISGGEGTVSLWVKSSPSNNIWNSGSYQYFIDSSGANDYFVIQKANNNQTYFSLYKNSTWYQVGYNTSALSQAGWHLIVAKWLASSSSTDYLAISVDGSSFTTSTQSIAPLTLGTLHIGSNSTGTLYLLDALTSDLRIFNKALSAGEVANLYYEGLSTHASSTESDDRYDAGVKTYTSPVIDLGANGEWGEIPFDITQALHGGTVNYFTRTSADNSTWTSWSSVAGSVIASDPRRYLQWKADMSASADQSDTPVISGLTVRYIEDTTPPVNPAAAALGFANEASTSATLVSGDFANHARPKFTWEEALDTAGNGQSASGVASYRMLLSTDVNSTPSAHLADPCYVETSPTARSFVVGTSPSTCTLTDNTWYLRLQSKDNSGNISDPSTIFVYKYDGTAPRAPASVSSTTIGYSADNAFTFFWPSASDDGQHQSGIIYYQYKTGAEDGTYSEWRNSNAAGEPLVTEVSNVEAYQQGQNFFFVRSVDLAGNVSASTTNVGVAPFYYNSDAPTAPTNLQIVPATSESTPATANIFTVTWDKPSSYSGEIAKYYYCVNCTPGATTMTETTAAETVNRTLEGIALATQQGKNTFYIVAEDNNVNTSTGFGNRNFGAYAQADFYTLTVAPGSPQDLSISDASSRTASLWRLTLSWKAPATGGTPARYEIFRSSDDGATYTNLGNTSTVAFTDSDLTQGKKYYYKIRAVDNAGSVSLFTSVVSLAPEGKYVEPPSAGGVPSVSTGSTTATVTWTTDRTSYGTIEYGKTSAYGSAAAETTATAKHSIKFTGLAPGTLYHYRVQALDESSLVGYNRSSAYSADYTFTTLSTPTISKVEVSDLSLESAVITWVSSSLTSADIEYGETTAYGKTLEVSVGTTESTHSVKVNSLTHSTTYHFRIKGLDVDGNDIISDDYTFQTIIFPKFTAMVLNTDQEETGTAVVLGWVSNVPTTGTLEYQSVKVDPEYAKKSSKNLSSPTVLQAMTQDELAAIPVVPVSTVKKIAQTESVLQHVERISDLEDGAMYVITVRGRDGYGNEVVSDPIRYVTGADTRPPQMKNLIFETPISGTGPDAKVQIIISWDTDEPSIGQVAWGEGSGSEYSQLSEKEEGMATKHVIVLRELRPTTSYHLKVISTDRMKNASESQDTVVVTPSAQSAAFDVIIKNLEDIFGFLKL